MKLGTLGRLGDKSRSNVERIIKVRGCAGVIWINVSPDKVC